MATCILGTEAQAMTPYPVNVAITAVPLAEKPHFIQIYGPTFVALVAAMVAGLIAYRQWRTAQSKLNLDLFDKRFEVYEGVATLLVTTTLGHSVKPEVMQKFLNQSKGSRWLFDDKFADYLDEMWKKAMELQRLERAVPSQLFSDEANALVAWFDKESKGMDARMSKYMRIVHSPVRHWLVTTWKRLKSLTWNR